MICHSLNYNVSLLMCSRICLPFLSCDLVTWSTHVIIQYSRAVPIVSVMIVSSKIYSVHSDSFIIFEKFWFILQFSWFGVEMSFGIIISSCKSLKVAFCNFSWLILNESSVSVPVEFVRKSIWQWLSGVYWPKMLYAIVWPHVIAIFDTCNSSFRFEGRFRWVWKVLD